MDWPVVGLLLLVAVVIAVPIWYLQRRAPGRHSYPAQTLSEPAEPGTEGMTVAGAGEVGPGPDEPPR
jgi:hypothetical protein